MKKNYSIWIISFFDFYLINDIHHYNDYGANIIK